MQINVDYHINDRKYYHKINPVNHNKHIKKKTGMDSTPIAFYNDIII